MDAKSWRVMFRPHSITDENTEVIKAKEVSAHDKDGSATADITKTPMQADNAESSITVTSENMLFRVESRECNEKELRSCRGFSRTRPAHSEVVNCKA